MANTTMSFSKYLNDNYEKIKGTHTHTRIGDKTDKISGGTYSITNEEEFMTKYYDHVFVKGNKEYLTEKQFKEDAPIVIDVDMRYSTGITTRQHTENHVIDLIDMYFNHIAKVCDTPDAQKIEVFVMEKPKVNVLDTKTKDGVHIIIGLSIHKDLQVKLRQAALPNLKIVWEDLPLTNDIEDLIDASFP